MAKKKWEAWPRPKPWPGFHEVVSDGTWLDPGALLRVLGFYRPRPVRLGRISPL